MKVCGPRKSRKNPDSYTKEELVELLSKKLGVSRSSLNKLPKDELCSMLTKSRRSPSKSSRKSSRRSPSKSSRAPSVKVHTGKVCSNRKIKEFPNRYTKQELVLIALQYADLLNLKKSEIKTLKVSELCALLSRNKIDIPDKTSFRYMEHPVKGVRKTKKVVEFDDKVEIIKSKSRDCVNRSKLPLKAHQKKVVNYLKKHRGVIAVHQVGSGKTLTAVTASQCYLETYPTSKVIVITPTSLQANFKKELEAYGGNSKDKRYEFYTIQGFVNASKRGEVECERKMLIVDEAHNLRTAPGETVIIKEKKVGIMAKHVIECAKKARKVLLLTATPLVNTPTDIIPLVAMVKGVDPMSEAVFKTRYDLLRNSKKGEYTISPESKERLEADLKCLFSFYDRGDELADDYPKKDENVLFLEMSPSFYDKYLQVEENQIDEYLSKVFGDVYGLADESANLKAFFNGVRRATNNLEEENSPKVNWIVEQVSKKPQKYKFVIFSHFLNAGLQLLMTRFNNKNIKYAHIDGSMDMKKRKKAVDDYNSDKVQVLLISKAGGEGLDLKGTREIILMEPSWNETTVRQVVGRGVRYKSHSHLPKDQRNVKVTRLIMLKPKEYSQRRVLLEDSFRQVMDWAEENSEILSVDFYLYKLAEKKQEVNDIFSKALESVSIEKSKC